MERSGLTEEQAKARIELQKQTFDVEYPFVRYIDTGSSEEETNRQVIRMLAGLYTDK